MEFLEEFTEEQIHQAQKELDRLCNEFDIPRFILGADKPRWKELVMSMIGLHHTPKAGGRPKARTDDQNLDIIHDIICATEFSTIDANGKEIKEPTKVKKAIYDAVEKYGEEYGLTEKDYDSGGKKSPFGVVRGILYNEHPRMKRRQTEEDYEVDYPPEYYATFKHKMKDKKQKDSK